MRLTYRLGTYLYIMRKRHNLAMEYGCLRQGAWNGYGLPKLVNDLIVEVDLII